MNIICPVFTEAVRNHFCTVRAFRMDNGKTYNFSDWNGEYWCEWWEEANPDNCGRYAYPIYGEDEDGDFALIGIDF